MSSLLSWLPQRKTLQKVWQHSVSSDHSINKDVFLVLWHPREAHRELEQSWRPVMRQHSVSSHNTPWTLTTLDELWCNSVCSDNTPCVLKTLGELGQHCRCPRCSQNVVGGMAAATKLFDKKSRTWIWNALSGKWPASCPASCPANYPANFPANTLLGSMLAMKPL